MAGEHPTPNQNDGDVNFPPVKYTVYLVDGAIDPGDKTAVLTKATAGAYTLAAPTNPDMNGQQMRIVSDTAAAHVVTGVYQPTGTTLTFAAAAGNQCDLTAYDGTWNVGNLTGVTIA